MINLRQIQLLLLSFLLTLPMSAQRTNQGSTTGSDVETITVNNLGRRVSFKMIRVKAGTFQMGNTLGISEEPVHSVTLTNDYYIGETEVTQELWEAVMGSNPSQAKGAQNPVESISWNDCKTFINKLNTLTGKRFRLPTEAEWEYAARGGNKSRNYTYSGSNYPDEVAWFFETSRLKLHPVKTKAPNELGIYDMSGNVWEWCEDWYGRSYYKNSPTTNPTGPASGASRVIRGGSWDGDASGCRTTKRLDFAPTYSSYTFGFRLALNASPKGNTVTAKNERTFTEASVKTFTVKNNGRTVSFKMIGIAAGTFKMGSTSGDSDERPVHSVTLTNDYYIGETEVTQELWEAVMGSNPSRFKGAQNPVEQVNWEDCKTFINKLNSLTGQSFRLPTEAEWEYAARGGSKSLNYTYSGSNNIDDVAWYHVNSRSKAHPVKTKEPNELGIYDMSGNVWTWCEDWYDSSYYKNSPSTNPTGPASGYYRVIRGGGWSFSAEGSRSADRVSCTPSKRGFNIGLRLAL